MTIFNSAILRQGGLYFSQSKQQYGLRLNNT